MKCSSALLLLGKFRYKYFIGRNCYSLKFHQENEYFKEPLIIFFWNVFLITEIYRKAGFSIEMYFIFPGFVVSCCSAAYIKVGSEYVYAYTTSVHAGSHDYVSFGSSFNITGTVRLQKSDSSLIKVKLEDLKYSSYNGEQDFYPAPEVSSRAYQELNPLTEPFHVRLNGNNLADSIVLSESIPEWARNIHRGLATTLQLDTQKISGAESNVEVTEVSYSINRPAQTDSSTYLP